MLAIFDGDLDAATAAGLEPERRAMLEFVKKLTFEAYKVNQGDIDVLRHYGYNDVQIAEIIYDTALFAMYNRVADGFGIGSSGLMNLPVEVVKKIAPNPE